VSEPTLESLGPLTHREAAKQALDAIGKRLPAGGVSVATDANTDTGGIMVHVQPRHMTIPDVFFMVHVDPITGTAEVQP